LVFSDCCDVIAGNRGRIKRIVAKNAKIEAVVMIQSIHGAKPHKSFAVLKNRPDNAFGQSFVAGEVFKAGGIRLFVYFCNILLLSKSKL